MLPIGVLFAVNPFTDTATLCDMNECTLERNHLPAQFVENALPSLEVVMHMRNLMSRHMYVKSHTNVTFVTGLSQRLKFCVVIFVATQEKNHMNARSVQNAFLGQRDLKDT